MVRESHRLLELSIQNIVGISRIMDLKKEIINLRKAVATAEISETLKLHLLRWHIKFCSDKLGGNGGFTFMVRTSWGIHKANIFENME